MPIRGHQGLNKKTILLPNAVTFDYFMQSP